MAERLIGIDVGGTKMLGVAVERHPTSQVVTQVLVPTPTTAEGVVDGLVGLAAELGVQDHLGLGLAGLVENGSILRAAPNLQCMIDVPVRDLLVDRLGVDVRVDNDATCALAAEMTLGVAQDAADVVLVTMGTGIGGGVAIGGRIARGAHGFAGEPGHMCVDPVGPVCVCGRRGCWERFASGAGLMWMAEQRGLVGADGSPLGGEALAVLARGGESEALEVWGEFSLWLARGLAGLADVLDPELMVLGGGLISSADLFLDRTRDLFSDEVLGGAARHRTRIEPARCGPAAGAIGAALLH